MALDPEELRNVVQRIAAPEAAERIIASMQPSVRIGCGESGAPLRLGQSHFGGSAQVPADFEWPTCAPVPPPMARAASSLSGFFSRLLRPFSKPQPEPAAESPEPDQPRVPLTLMAQLNLTELPPGVDLGLPTAGHLLFFLDYVSYPFYGGSGEPVDRWRVTWLPADDRPLVDMARPGGTSSGNGRPLQFEVEWLVDAAALDELPDDQDEAILEWQLERIEKSPPNHRLRGYPQAVQDEPAYEAEMALRGTTDYKSLRGQEDEVLARWQLLLQFDTDDRLGWSWGDAGMVYFLIPKEDLPRRRFDRVMAVMQCY